MTPSLDISKLNLFKQEAMLQSGIDSDRSGALCCFGSTPAMKSSELAYFSFKNKINKSFPREAFCEGIYFRVQFSN